MNKITFANSISIAQIYQDFTGITLSERQIRNTIVCPFHGDTNPSMKLYVDKNKFKCFGCGLYGGSIDFVLHLVHKGEQSHFVEVVNMLCEKYNYDGEDTGFTAIRNPEAYQNKVNYTAKLANVANAFAFALQHTDQTSNYFTARGIREDIQKEYGLGFCSKDIKFNTDKDLSPFIQAGLTNPTGANLYANRWIIPIRDQNGYVIGYAGRDADAKEAKYINSPDSDYFHKSDILFNFDKAKTYDTIFVVEGYIDCLTLIAAGIPNVVALMGCSLSPAQMSLLNNKHIVLALDNDNAGKKATAKIIAEYKTVKFDVIDEYRYKDFNESIVGVTCDSAYEYISDVCAHYSSGLTWFINYFKTTHVMSLQQCQEELWETVAKIIGSREREYRELYPINTSYSPIAFKKIWSAFDQVIEED